MCALIFQGFQARRGRFRTGLNSLVGALAGVELKLEVIDMFKGLRNVHCEYQHLYQRDTIAKNGYVAKQPLARREWS